jgi:hypothetical protein
MYQQHCPCARVPCKVCSGACASRDDDSIVVSGFGGSAAGSVGATWWGSVDVTGSAQRGASPGADDVVSWFARLSFPSGPGCH